MKKISRMTCICLFIFPNWARADLQSDRDREILRAAKDDRTLTNKQKLFEHRCEMIKKYLGYDKTVADQAIKHSCDMPQLGITLYAGKDLGENSPEDIAQYFQDELEKHRVKAKIFIKHNHPHGTSMAFYINGSSWLREPVNPLKGIELIEAMAAETLLVLFTEGRIKEWPKDIEKPIEKLSAKNVAQAR